MPKLAEFNKSESRIQADCVRWYRNSFCLRHYNPRCMIFSVPNESNGSKAMKLIQTGLYPGVADLVICHRTRWLFVEVKTPTGIQSAKQRLFQEHCKQMNIQYELVRSLEDFQEIIKKL